MNGRPVMLCRVCKTKIYFSWHDREITCPNPTCRAKHPPPKRNNIARLPKTNKDGGNTNDDGNIWSG